MSDANLRLVIVALSGICLACLAGMVFLEAIGANKIDALSLIASSCSGTLFGLLVPTKAKQ